MARPTLELSVPAGTGAAPSPATGAGAALSQGRTEQAEITFIGTATTLIRVAGFTLLTDPNFLRQGQRAYVGLGLTTRRLTQPACRIDELPELDAVVLSHHHGDHFDRVAAAGLDRELPVVTEPHAARKLLRQGFRHPVPLETWEFQELRRGAARLRVTSLPGKHAPEPLGHLVPPVMGSLLDFHLHDRHVLRIYVTGDTLFHGGLDEIGRRCPGIDLFLIHLGGTRVAGVLLTMDAPQGVEALRTVRPERAIPIHFDDYTLFRSPLDDFRRALDDAALSTEVHYLERGETFRLPIRAKT